jgi:hypothetical protein
VRAIEQWIAYADIPPATYVFRGVLLDGSLTSQPTPRSIQHILAARRTMVDTGRAAQLAREGKTDDEIAVVMGASTAIGVGLDASLADVVARGRRLREHRPEREPLLL